MDTCKDLKVYVDKSESCEAYVCVSANLRKVNFHKL